MIIIKIYLVLVTFDYPVINNKVRYFKSIVYHVICFTKYFINHSCPPLKLFQDRELRLMPEESSVFHLFNWLTAVVTWLVYHDLFGLFSNKYILHTHLSLIHNEFISVAKYQKKYDHLLPTYRIWFVRQYIVLILGLLKSIWDT